MATFRQSLVDVINAKPLVFIKGPLSEDARMHKQKLMEILVQRKGTELQSLEAATLLQMVMSGDWRNQTAPEYVVREGVEPSQDQVRKMMGHVLCH
eukprot:939323-Amphidinium_carterae.1